MYKERKRKSEDRSRSREINRGRETEVSWWLNPVGGEAMLGWGYPADWVRNQIVCSFPLSHSFPCPARLSSLARASKLVKKQSTICAINYGEAAGACLVHGQPAVQGRSCGKKALPTFPFFFAGKGQCTNRICYHIVHRLESKDSDFCYTCPSTDVHRYKINK